MGGVFQKKGNMRMELLELAQEGDWEQVNVLIRQVQALHASWSPDVYEVVEYPYPMEYFLEDIQDKCLYVAKKEAFIVGYVRFRLWETNGAGSVKRKMMQIDDIGVEESLRNQGIGRKIMEDLKELAKSIGCTDLNLYVDAKNENAFAYYKKCGFYVSNIGMLMKL